VLVVDDEPDLIELVSLTLSRMNLATDRRPIWPARAPGSVSAVSICAFTDMRLPDGDGLDLVAWIQQRHRRAAGPVITAHGNVESAVRALKLGAFDFVSKPLDLGVLRKLVAKAISCPSGVHRRPACPRTARGCWASARMTALRDLVARVARSQAPVHITGESGTARSWWAR